MALFSAMSMTIVGSVIMVIAILWLLLHARKKKVRSSKALEESGIELTKDEAEFKKLALKKMKLLHEIREGMGVIISAFNEEGMGGVKKSLKPFEEKLDDMGKILEKQLDLLQEMTSIDKADLQYLRHMSVTVGGKKERLHISEFMDKIEHVWGTVDYSKLDGDVYKDVYNDDIMRESDAICQGAKLIAYNLTHILVLFHKLKIILEGAKKEKKKGQTHLMQVLAEEFAKLKAGRFGKDKNFDQVIKNIKEDVIPPFERRVEDELYLINRFLFSHTNTLRHHTAQLNQNEAAKRFPKGPFLHLEGHPVSMVYDITSRAKRNLGAHQRIPLGDLPEKFAIGSDPHKCLVVLGHGAPEVQAVLDREGNKCSLTAEEGTPGVFVVRKDPGLIVLCCGKDDKERMKSLLGKKEGGYDKIAKMIKPKQKENDIYKGKTIVLKKGDGIVLAFGYGFVFSED
ncbi:hypothetical protein KY359_06165 [Candidatus Woesearchaeota archaeon]|nr:hypothetical protein [Candidatus Woesearchaeota archaeon]